MDYAVVEFGKLGVVPTVSRADKVACDALEAVDVMGMAPGAFFKVGSGVFISTIHAAVSVVVHGAVADVVFIHEIDDICNRFGVVGRVAVDFHIENVSATCHFVIWGFDFRFVARRAVVVDRDVV